MWQQTHKRRFSSEERLSSKERQIARRSSALLQIPKSRRDSSANFGSHQLNVQEANVSIPQFHRIGNHFVGCRTANGWIACARFVGYGDTSVAFTQTTLKHKFILLLEPDVRKKTVRETHRNQNQKENREVDKLKHLVYVLTNAHSTQCESQLYIFEDNEAVIKMIIKGRSPTIRHVSRIQRVAIDWLFDRITLDTRIQIKYVDTKNQFGDMNQRKLHA